MRKFALLFVAVIVLAGLPVLSAAQEPVRLELVLQAKSPPGTWGAAVLSGDGELAIDGTAAGLWDCGIGRKSRTLRGHTDATHRIVGEHE